MRRTRRTFAAMLATACTGLFTTTAGGATARSVTTDECKEEGSTMIAVMMRGICLGGGLHGKAING